MKKLVYGTLFLAAVGIGLSSCEKEEVSKNQTLELSEGNEAVISQKAAPGSGNNGRFSSESCEEEKTGCTAVVVVYGISYVDDLINTSGDVQASMQYFSTNGNQFMNALTQNELSALVNGNLSIEYKTTTDETSYFAIRDHVQSVDLKVIPVTVD